MLRWSALLLHIGCAKKSKTSKMYVYSFLSALFIIQMLESGDIPSQLLEGSGYREMNLQFQNEDAKSAIPEDENFVCIDQVLGKGSTEEKDVPMTCSVISLSAQIFPQGKQRDLRLKIASELISGSKQPLQPGIMAHNDKLFSEQDKPITSMPSHHNFNSLFTIICDSSTAMFHELEVEHQEVAYERFRSMRSNRSAQTNNANPMNISYNDEVQKAGGALIPQNQLDDAIWHRGSSIDIVFRLVMFFNSLPTYIPKQKPIVALRSFER